MKSQSEIYKIRIKRKWHVIPCLIFVSFLLVGCYSNPSRNPRRTDDGFNYAEVSIGNEITDDDFDENTYESNDNLNEELKFNTDERLYGSWKNSLEDIYETFSVDVSFLESTWTFRESGIASRSSESLGNFRFIYYWHLEDDILYLYSFMRGIGDEIRWQPDNDISFTIEWLNEDTISLLRIDVEDRDPDIFLRVN